MDENEIIFFNEEKFNPEMDPIINENKINRFKKFKKLL